MNTTKVSQKKVKVSVEIKCRRTWLNGCSFLLALHRVQLNYWTYKALVLKAPRKLSKYYFHYVCASKVHASFVSQNDINFHDLQQHCSCSLSIQSKLLNRIFHSQLRNGLINSAFVNCNGALGARVHHDQGDNCQPRSGTARHQQRGRCHPLSARLGEQTPVRPAKVRKSRSIIHQLQVSIYSLIHKCTFGRVSRSRKFSTAAIFSVYWNSNVHFEQIITTRPHGKTFSYHPRLRLHDPHLFFFEIGENSIDVHHENVLTLYACLLIVLPKALYRKTPVSHAKREFWKQTESVLSIT